MVTSFVESIYVFIAGGPGNEEMVPGVQINRGPTNYAQMFHGKNSQGRTNTEKFLKDFVGIPENVQAKRPKKERQVKTLKKKATETDK